MTDRAIALLNEQQSKVKERSAPWMVAEQLKDICRQEPDNAELIAQDLENPEMGIVQAEKKIKAFADAHKTGSLWLCGAQLEGQPLDGSRKEHRHPAGRHQSKAHERGDRRALWGDSKTLRISAQDAA